VIGETTGDNFRMTSMRTYKALVLAGILGVVAACASLDVENPNAPDRTRALSEAADISSLLGGGYYNWYFGTQYYAPSVPTSVMASHNTMSWGNWGARFYSSVPRRGFQNDPSDVNSNELGEINWYQNYSSLVAANLAIQQAENTDIFPTTDVALQATSKMLVAGSRFLQGASLANLALFYNQGFVLDEKTVDPSILPFQSADKMRDSALLHLDQAIAAATAPGVSFTLPGSYFNKATGWTNAQLAQMASTEAARLIAYFPRTAAQLAAMSAADWGKVEAYARNGITFAPSIAGDNNVWYDGYKNVGQDWDTWVRVNQRVVALLDPSQPTTYAFGCPAPAPGCTNPAPAPVSADQRYDPTPRDDASAGSLATKDFVYVTYDNFNPARGVYHFSQVGHNRYACHGILSADGGGVCEVPFLLVAENDLLLAEALVRQNKNLTEAATLINKTRVTRGGLSALTGTAADLAATQGLHPTTYGTLNVPAGVQSILMRAIMYERDIELMQSSAVTPFYDARRTDRFSTFFVNAANDLKDTPRQFPVPGKELQTLLREMYTTIGADSVKGAVSAIRVRNSVFNPGASPAGRTQGTLYRIGDRFVGVGRVGDIAEALRLRGREEMRKPF
jgi:starch-binding outer membrane protein, SusD/RagB family